MLDNDIAEPSFSSWAPPCLWVHKQNETFWFCTDYRKVKCDNLIPTHFPSWKTVLIKLVLLQSDSQEIERPVAYFSKKFNSYQLN